MRTIDANTLCPALDCKKCIHYEVCYSVAECLNYLPNFSCNHYAEERSKGKWVDLMAKEGYVECPFCGKQITGGDLNFCVKCGADLRGDPV